MTPDWIDRFRRIALVCGTIVVAVVVGWFGWQLATSRGERSVGYVSSTDKATRQNVVAPNNATRRTESDTTQRLTSSATIVSKASTTGLPKTIGTTANPSKAPRSANAILSDLVRVKSRFAELEQRLVSEHPELPGVLESAQKAADWRSRQAALGEALHKFLKEHQSNAQEIGKALSLRDPEMMLRLLDDQQFGPLMRDLFANAGFAKAGTGMLRMWDQAAGMSQTSYPDITTFEQFREALLARQGAYAEAYTQAASRFQMSSDVLQANELAREGYMQSNWLNKYYQSFMVGEISDLRTAYERLRTEAVSSIQMQKNGPLYNEFLTAPKSLGRSL